MDEDTHDDYALERVGWIARDLAGNMLRVMRGAGRPLELLEQITALVSAAKAAKAPGIVITRTMQDALTYGFKDDRPIHPDLDTLHMERAAARMIAARLLCQDLQLTKGRSEFFEAFYDLERVRRKNREEYLATLAKAPAPKPRRQRKAPIQPSKPKLAPKPASPPQAAEEDIDPRSWRTTADYMKLRREQLLRQRQELQPEEE